MLVRYLNYVFLCVTRNNEFIYYNFYYVRKDGQFQMPRIGKWARIHVMKLRQPNNFSQVYFEPKKDAQVIRVRGGGTSFLNRTTCSNSSSDGKSTKSKQ